MSVDLSNIKIDSVSVNKETKSFTAHLHSTEFVMYSQIVAVRDNLRSTLKCDKLDVDFICHEAFDDVVKIPSRLKVLWASVLQYIQEKHVGMWAILKNSNAVYEDDVLKIYVPGKLSIAVLCIGAATCVCYFF